MKTNQRYKIKSAKTCTWIHAARMIAQKECRNQMWKCSKDEKIVMELTVFWGNNRRQDVHNLHKISADALQGIVYEDDRWLLIRDINFSVDKKTPRAEFVFYRLEDKE